MVVSNKMKKVKLISADSQESIEMEEYSDEDDEVFVTRNNRNGESGGDAARRPLMKKKKRGKQNGDFHATVRSSNPKYRRCCGPICWALLAFKSLIGGLAITIILVNYFTHAGWYFWRWGSSQAYPYAPCHDLEVTPVWQVKFPKFGTEGNFRLLNISKDDVLDIVFGFGTGADGYNVPDVVCDIYFEGKSPCFGGVMALDGRTGKTLWTRWAKHEIFALTCQGDLNNDSTIDCMAGGRAGVLFALSGTDGTILWEFGNHAVQSDLMSVYAAQFVHDLNGDGTPEILAVHGGDELSDPALEEKMFGRIIIFDGRNGSVLRWMQTPDRRESYYPPQILTWLDGEQFVLFGTGGNSRSGSLYVIPLVDLYKRNLAKAVAIYTDEMKGMLTPAALVDVDGDNIEDIVIATFNSHVVAINGRTFQQIWKTSFADSESYSTISVGFFDEDDVPDFLVKYQHGPGYPVYDFEQTVILSGKNGSKISDTLIDSIGSQSSPITLMAMGKGNDIFLHWTSNCKNHDKEHLQYSFPEGELMHDQMRADICGSLFGTRQEATFLALQRFNSTREIPIYNSLSWDAFEHANATNTSALADIYVKKNPNQENSLKTGGDKYSVLPYKKDDFNSLLELLQKDIDQDYATDPESVGYAEGEEQPEGVRIQMPKDDKLVQTGEVMPNVAYSQPHNVQKYRPELGAQVDNFENPYVVRNYPPQQQQQQQMPSPYQQGYPGTMGRRKKRELKDYNWGIHRLMSTGTLAPPMLGANDTMDVVFATHWIYPSRSPVLQPDDKKCIDAALEQRTDLDQLTEEDLTVLKDDILSDCLKKSGHGPNKDAIYETPSDYDPFKVNMGQLTVFRFTLRCVCKESLLGDRRQCGKFLPYGQQGWPSFMGKAGDARFNVREIIRNKLGLKR